MLTKKVKSLYSENYKSLKKEIEDTHKLNMIYSGTRILKQFNFTFMNWINIVFVLLNQNVMLLIYMISVTMSSSIEISRT